MGPIYSNSLHIVMNMQISLSIFIYGNQNGQEGQQTSLDHIHLINRQSQRDMGFLYPDNSACKIHERNEFYLVRLVYKLSNIGDIKASLFLFYGYFIVCICCI